MGSEVWVVSVRTSCFVETGHSPCLMTWTCWTVVLALHSHLSKRLMKKKVSSLAVSGLPSAPWPFPPFPRNLREDVVSAKTITLSRNILVVGSLDKRQGWDFKRASATGFRTSGSESGLSNCAANSWTKNELLNMSSIVWRGVLWMRLG